MLFYLYAVLGVSMFGTNDPDHMASLHTTLLTLFRCATLEDWSDVMYTAMLGKVVWELDPVCVQGVVMTQQWRLVSMTCRVQQVGL